ncbi:MAG: energy-coupling factor ABC transporter permease [Rhodocyclaceae bacterium]|nr:energy-coupling factor ABC transporter permease [Rhodocyclaceae bacterium]
MNFPEGLLPPVWYVGAFLPLALVWLWCLRHLPWQRLKDPDIHHVWMGAIVALVLIWSLRAGVRPGLNFHLLGGAAVQLMFGPELAIAVLSVVLAAVTYNSHLSWSAYGLNAMVMVVVPVVYSRFHLWAVERFLPANFFVYLFGGTFFGAALSILVTGVVANLVFFLTGVYSAPYLLDNYLPYFLLLAFSEAFLTNTAVTLMVVYRPRWVSTFDDRRYLLNK